MMGAYCEERLSQNNETPHKSITEPQTSCFVGTEGLSGTTKNANQLQVPVAMPGRAGRAQQRPPI